MKEIHPVARFRAFVKDRSHDQEERIRLLVFLTGTSLLTIFMLMHVIGSIGLGMPILQGISWILIVTTLTYVTFYITGRLTLTAAFAAYSLTAQILEVARIVYLVLAQPEGHATMIQGNLIGSYTILLYLALGFVPRIPVYVTVMGLAGLFFAGFYDGGVINRQMVVLLALLNIFTCLLATISQRGLHNIQEESHGYQTTQAHILKTLRITQEELDAYLELCRNRKPQDTGEPLLFWLLDEQKKHNLLEAAGRLQKKYEAKQQNFARKFPMFSDVELEVCRLVAEGKTVSEIAIITGKSISNVSTVRGNIRKKLSLERETDLRTFLVGFETEKVKVAEFSDRGRNVEGSQVKKEKERKMGNRSIR